MEHHRTILCVRLAGHMHTFYDYDYSSLSPGMAVLAGPQCTCFIARPIKTNDALKNRAEGFCVLLFRPRLLRL